MSWSRRSRRRPAPGWGPPGHEVALARSAAEVEDRCELADVSFEAHLRHALAATAARSAGGPGGGPADAAASGCPTETAARTCCPTETAAGTCCREHEEDGR